MRSTARVCNWQSNLISTAIGSYEFGFYHLFLINSMCIKMFFCCTVGRPMKRCICENRKAHPISVVFGGWFEGSWKDFWFDYSNALVLINLRKMFCCLTSVATPLLWLLWVCAAAKFANINLFYVWEEKLYFTLCKSNGPSCPYVCNGPGRRFPQKIWKTHFLCLPSNIIRRGGIASSVLKGRHNILNLDVRTNLEANLNAYCCGK